MVRERKYSKHYDLSHNILYNSFPKEYTKTIGVPGKFVKKINRRVHLKDGTTGEMDSAYIALPDGKILFKKASVCLEHQSKPVDDEKLDAIGYYDIQLVTDENLPTLIVVASPSHPKKSKNQLKRTPSDCLKIYFVDLTEKNIYERLNRLNEIIKTNEKISTEEALNLGVIPLYAPKKHTQEITETIISHYIEIHQDLSLEMEKCLYSVITILTDAHIDNENEYRRLTKMIDKNTSTEAKQHFGMYDGLIESLRYREEDLAEANKTIAEKDKILTEAQNEINNLKNEIRQLKNHNPR